MSKGKIYTLNEVQQHLNKKPKYIDKLHEWQVFSAFISYHNSKKLFKLRPCLITDTGEVYVTIKALTTSPEEPIDKNYYKIKNIKEAKLNEDSWVLLKDIEIDKYFLWKYIGTLSDEDKIGIKNKLNNG